MPSLRAKLFNRYIRTVMKPKRLHEIDPPVLRDWAETHVIALLPKGVAREDVAGAISGEWHRPQTARRPRGPSRAVLYLHGGGYIFGSPRTHRTLTYPLALAAKADIFSLAYRLAPEHPCPAAIEDALAAYDWLVDGGRRIGEIVIAGDSAGGGLALATLLALRDRGSPMPAGAVFYSPWTDLAVTGPSVAANAESDAMFHRDAIKGSAPRYLGGLDASDPRASPLYADLAGLPPLLIFASEAEMLLDDSSRFAAKAKAAGVDATFVRRAGLVHVWPLFHPLMPEAKEAIARSGAFIRARTGAR